MAVVLVLSLMRPNSGNLGTASRIRQHLEYGGLRCSLKDSRDFTDIKHLERYIDDNSIDLVIGIHAFHSGKLLSGLPVLTVIVFGGTDINEFSKQAEKRNIMTRAVMYAKSLVVFSDSMFEQVSLLWPDVTHKVVKIPPGIQTSPSSFNLKGHLLQQYSINCDKIFTVIGGIRPVKDPFFLINQFADEFKTRPDVVLIFIGPMFEEQYARLFQEQIISLPGVHYIGTLALEDVHASLRDSFALVNCSLSEGLSTAVLEAMSLDVPVIARSVAGNLAVIEEGGTGLLFNTPQGCVQQMQALLSNDELRHRITGNAKQFVHQNHVWSQERFQYLDLVRSMTNKF